MSISGTPLTVLADCPAGCISRQSSRRLPAHPPVFFRVRGWFKLVGLRYSDFRAFSQTKARLAARNAKRAIFRIAEKPADSVPSTVLKSIYLLRYLSRRL